MPAKPFEAYPGNEPYIFVSYAHTDRDLVYPELKRLHEAGYRVWYDEGIPPSEHWAGVIPNRISTCAVFLLFISPAAVASKWVRKEISFAHRLPRELPILPVYLSETTVDAELDFQVGDTQALLRHRLDEAEFRSRLDQQLRKFPGLIPDAPDEVERVARELELMSGSYRGMFANHPAPDGYTAATWFQ